MCVCVCVFVYGYSTVKNDLTKVDSAQSQDTACPRTSASVSPENAGYPQSSTCMRRGMATLHTKYHQFLWNPTNLLYNGKRRTACISTLHCLSHHDSIGLSKQDLRKAAPEQCSCQTIRMDRKLFPYLTMRHLLYPWSVENPNSTL